MRNLLCFQGVPWIGMGLLWQRMMPLIRCWKILVPLKMSEDFESVCSKMERRVMMREPLCQSQWQDVASDGDSNSSQIADSFQFQPPGWEQCNRVVMFVLPG
jgi:hypothetical protein